jgi:small subunit ribosomal protein S18
VIKKPYTNRNIENTMAKQCYFSQNNIKHIDYKDVDLLKKFLNPHARVITRKRTGTTSKHQRKLAEAVSRARFMGLLPYVSR